MTTSDPDDALQLLVSQTGSEQQFVESFGAPQLLDISSLTQMANEFMKALPAQTQSIDSLALGNLSQAPAAAVLAPVSLTSAPLSTSPLPNSNASSNLLPSGAIPASLNQSTAMSALDASSLSAASVNPMPIVGQTAISGSSFDPIAQADNLLNQSFGFLNEIRPLSEAAINSNESISSFQSIYSRSVSNELNLHKQEKYLPDWQKLSNPLFLENEAQLPPVKSVYAEPMRQFDSVNVIPSLEAFDYGNMQVGKLGLPLQTFDIATIRRDFPILNEQIKGHDLIWLDNAATTQKPQAVIDRLNYFYTHENSNIHRSAHELAARSSDAYDAARESVRRFINASSSKEIIFVRGATEGINLVAQSWGRQNIQKDDEIVITWLEHHANIVPWQMLCAEKGARLKVAPVDDHGQLILAEYERLLGPKTKLVSVTQVSNALGTVTPVDKLVEAAHRFGAKVLVDGAQAISHMRVDVQEYDCDFYVFSGHKVFAPTGIGAVYAKEEVLESMGPWQGGGNMIQDVTFERTLYQAAPARFEAGTGNIADAIGLGAAIDYLDRIGMDNITRHENELLNYGTQGLKTIPGLHLIGTAAHKAGVMSFVLDGFRTEDVSSALNQQGIAVRAGHHCAQPILRRFGLESTVRPSLALYNTCEDIDALINALTNITRGRGPSPL